MKYSFKKLFHHIVRGTNASNNGLALSPVLDYEERFRNRTTVPIFRIVDQKTKLFCVKLIPKPLLKSLQISN
jgi:hypothetical protein